MFASWPSNITVARDTPFTAASADRTGSTQPSHVMPEIRSVTVARCGTLWVPRVEAGRFAEHASAPNDKASSTDRLVTKDSGCAREYSRAGPKATDGISGKRGSAE